MRLKQWDDDFAPAPTPAPPISLDAYRRELREQERQQIEDSAVTLGFAYGILASVLAWLIMSGLLVHAVFRLTFAVAYVLQQAGVLR